MGAPRGPAARRPGTAARIAVALLAVAGAARAPADARAQAKPDEGGRGGDAGARIVAQGTPAGAAPCASCHGARGEGRAGAGMPRLAGQPEAYLRRQLDAYADGRRENAVMTPIARALDDAQRDAVSAHLASIGTNSGRAAPARRVRPDAPPADRADRLIRVGDADLRVQACANCHGPDARGVAPSFPALAGQHADYLLASLRTWRDGTRRTDPSGQMNAIAQRLHEGDLGALATRLSSLPPSGAASREASAAR